MNKAFLTLMIFILIIRINAQENNILKGTDSYEYSTNNDKFIFKYNSFKLIMNLSEEWNGYTMTVLNKNEEIIHTEEDSFFLGMVNDRYIIFDEGTSQSRSVSVFDAQTKKYVLQDSYYTDLVINGDLLEFYDVVDITDEVKKPVCPENLLEYSDFLGYVEKHIYNFQTLSLKETGIYKCIYLE